jgi:hypothetical protein
VKTAAGRGHRVGEQCVELAGDPAVEQPPQAGAYEDLKPDEEARAWIMPGLVRNPLDRQAHDATL